MRKAQRAGMFKQILDRYLAIFPHERPELTKLLEQLEKYDDQTLMSRRHFEVGHITASGFIIDPTQKQILLIEHRFLRLLIQPGGHLEPEDKDTLQGAYRELKEEVGLHKDDLMYLPMEAEQPLVPFDLNVHFYRDRPEKGEPAHYHFDCRYVFRLKKQQQGTPRLEEVKSVHWVSIAELGRLPGFERRQADKIARLLRAKQG